MLGCNVWTMWWVNIYAYAIVANYTTHINMYNGATCVG